MISYSFLLMHIALATITCTLATHSVKGDNSTEGQSNPGGCISDWRGLKKAYLDRQSGADVENSIFDFSSMDATKYGVLVIFYDVGPPPNTSTSGRRECCQRGSETASFTSSTGSGYSGAFILHSYMLKYFITIMQGTVPLAFIQHLKYPSSVGHHHSVATAGHERRNSCMIFLSRYIAIAPICGRNP